MKWKHDYMELEDVIEQFQEKYLNSDKLDPKQSTSEPRNIAILLNHYLDRCKELLWAEVNGGLEELYQEEVDEMMDGCLDHNSTPEKKIHRVWILEKIFKFL
jgi:hypothetical protein